MNIMNFSIILLSVLVPFSQCYNILVIFEIILPSHFTLFSNLFKTLATRGHNVTVISFYPQNEVIPNYRDVTLGGKDGLPVLRIANVDRIKSPRIEMYGTQNLVAEIAEKSCEALYSSPNLYKLLEENNSYDVIIREAFHSNCHNGITKKLKAPVIGLSTCLTLPWINPMFGAPDHPAYIPNSFLDHSDRKTFLERVESTIILVVNKLTYDWIIKSRGNALSMTHLGEDIVTEQDLDFRTSLLLSNTHFSFTRPRPLPPNVIEIGGIHITEDKPLPADLKKYIEESPHGVVYMSMGSMLKGVSFPLEKRLNFLKAFSQIKQRVIWKWENETMEGKPDNVLLYKWTPQKDLLCHPNVKAFVSHGGLLGTFESVHCGVPMLVLPQFGDQHANAAIIVENGFGIKMLLSEATDENILENLRIVLSDKYRKQAREVSRRFRDRPLSPMETAIYWINYVARYGGADFMRTAAVDMPFYQYYLLDVIGFILLVVFIALFVIYKLTKLVLSLLLGQKMKQNKMKNN